MQNQPIFVTDLPHEEDITAYAVHRSNNDISAVSQPFFIRFSSVDATAVSQLPPAASGIISLRGAAAR